MAAGDVTVTTLNNATAATIDTALTTIRTAGGANGTYGVLSLDGKVFCWGIEEA
ncbi:MAG: hypothetical protein KAS32_10445 [Candidatus Peribacteraceae bacterium]|nr:hypothetical protein [Candidatus Peribacteraceae bacterium]